MLPAPVSAALVSDSWEQAKAKAEEYGERLAHEAAEVAAVAKVRAAEAYEDIRADLSREKVRRAHQQL